IFNPPFTESYFYEKLDFYIMTYANAEITDQGQIQKDCSTFFTTLFEITKYGDYYFKDAQYFLFDNETNKLIDLYIHIHRTRSRLFVQKYGITKLIIPKIDGEIDRINRINEENIELITLYNEWKRNLRTFNLTDMVRWKNMTFIEKMKRVPHQMGFIERCRPDP